MWTKVNKPTSQAWTGVAKPAESSVMTIGGGGGVPIGMLLALTYAGNSVSSIITGWSSISKPTTDGFTKVAKPTT